MNTNIHTLINDATCELLKRLARTPDRTTLDMFVPEKLDDLKSDVIQTTLEHIAPKLCKEIYAAAGVPPVTAEISHTIYFPGIGEFVAQELTYDCTPALDIALDQYDPNEFDSFDEFLPENLFDLEPEFFDDIYRISVHLGLIENWPHGYEAYIIDGYEAYREFKLKELRETYGS